MMNEKNVSKLIELKYTKEGAILWRNNIGAYKDEKGNFIRYGLANSSHKMNQNIKSADFIGINPIVITKEHIGRTIGQFVSIEAKSEKGYKINEAQKKWRDLIKESGGYAIISNGSETL